MVIAPYWDENSGTWVFDEPTFGLIKEPFVLGIPHMIDRMVANMSEAKAGFRLIFSNKPFPQSDNRLTRLQKDMDGWWYEDQHTNKGWLCPAMFHYFKTAPKHIYIKAERLI